MGESCKPLPPLPFKRQVSFGSQSWFQPVFKNNSWEVSLHNCEKGKACVSYRLPTSNTGVLTAVEQAAAVLATAAVRSWRPRVSESVRDVSRLLPAPFPSTLALYFLCFKCMSLHGNEEMEWEDVLYFLFTLHVKPWVHTSYRLPWVNKIFLVYSHQCFPKNFAGSLQNMDHLHGSLPGWRNMAFI